MKKQILFIICFMVLCIKSSDIDSLPSGLVASATQPFMEQSQSAGQAATTSSQQSSDLEALAKLIMNYGYNSVEEGKIEKLNTEQLQELLQRLKVLYQEREQYLRKELVSIKQRLDFDLQKGIIDQDTYNVRKIVKMDNIAIEQEKNRNLEIAIRYIKTIIGQEMLVATKQKEVKQQKANSNLKVQNQQEVKSAKNRQQQQVKLQNFENRRLENTMTENRKNMIKAQQKIQQEESGPSGVAFVGGIVSPVELYKEAVDQNEESGPSDTAFMGGAEGAARAYTSEELGWFDWLYQKLFGNGDSN